ncbi:MAG: Gfo/Idh/MocA family oxidoreductase [Eubacterium sp.]|nr:Gfo/Idh/MocA family oxidoreductase [Eubacterium sp.]
MKALIVGYGSMGKRRARILRELYPDVSVLCTDSNPEKIAQANENGHVWCGSVDEAIEQKPDMAFICTSPGNHAPLIIKLLENRINIFTEITLTADRYDLIIETAKKNNAKAFISSSMLYDEQICAITNEVVSQTKPLTYIYHVGQYLPDWHPWEKYTEFFASKKETNGVREIYAIQLPWVINAFGEIQKVNAVSTKCTDLEFDFPDTYTAQFRHENGNIGTFTADITSRKATVYLEVLGEDLHLVWNGKPDGLKKYNFDTKEFEQIKTYDSVIKNSSYADVILENRYIDEIKDFVSFVIEGTEPKYSFDKDKVTLSVIDKIEGIS